MRNMGMSIMEKITMEIMSIMGKRNKNKNRKGS